MLFPNWGGAKPPDMLKVDVKTGEILVNRMAEVYWDDPENCMLQGARLKNANRKPSGTEPAKP